MVGFLLFIHVIVCIFLITIILLQSSKGGGLAGAFGGGGGSGAIFGGRGAATFLSKLTTALAIFFMLSSLGHNVFSSGSADSKSLIQEEVSKGNLSPASVLPAIPGATEGTQQSEQNNTETAPAGTEKAEEPKSQER